VSYSEILSGGPPKDGIPAIDAPQFVTIEEADPWLDPREPVILVVVGDVAKAYPIQILMWHEIVNDKDVTVTYCPLCNTGIAFERAFDGRLLDFGTTGRLRYSNLIMYDRQTETWWQQATGEAIAGEYTGHQLTFVPASMIAWGDFVVAYPDGLVLSRETGYARDYGRNPYTNYDDEDESPFLYRGPTTPDALPAKERVVTVDLNGETVAYPYEMLQELHAVNDTVGGVNIVVLWEAGTTSALDANRIASGDDVGATATFFRELDGERLTFAFDGERIRDEQMGSEWDVLGRAVSGPLEGSQLEPVVSVNHFWFSWAAFRPETRVYGQDIPSEGESPASEVGFTALESDFEIIVYQGADVLGGETVLLSEVLAQGKPVVLTMWAGLCPICRVEMPSLQAVYDEYQSEVTVLGIDIGPYVGLGSEEDGRALLEEMEITFPNGTASSILVMVDYRVLGTPSTYMLRPDGEIVKSWTGSLTKDQLREFTEELIRASQQGGE
jgi:thiol-disulfide isomerase/thioredoxin